MKKRCVKWVCFILIFFIAACSGTRLTKTNINEEFKEKPISNILVLAIADKHDIRVSFENKYVQAFESIGVNAVSSASVISLPPDLKLEKKHILDVVKKYNNDAVMITFLKNIEDKEIDTRDAVSLTSFYSYYGYAFFYAGQSGYSSTKTNVLLETRLYDVKTEQLIWSGQSQTLKAESANEIIHDVITVVINNLIKNEIVTINKEL